MHLSAYTVNQFQRHATGPQTQRAVAAVFRELAPIPPILGAAVDTFVTALQPHLSADGHAGLVELAGGITRQFAIPSSLTQFAELQDRFGTAIERVAPSTLRTVIRGMRSADGELATAPDPLKQVWHHIDGHALTLLRAIDCLMQAATVSDETTLPNPAVRTGATLVHTLMVMAGLKTLPTIEMEGANPLLFGATGLDPRKKTILLYAHYDVQPAGTPEHWKTAPHRATMLNGRMYGRGAADDLAGVVAALAVVHAYRKTGNGECPVNLAVVFEGEEEIGSKHMKELLARLRTRVPQLDPDAVLLTDVDNLQDGLPTISLTTRGMIALNVRLQTATHASHSGGCAFVPNAYTALIGALAAMGDASMLLHIPGMTDRERPIPDFLRRSLADIPHEALDRVHREATGMLPGVPFVGPATDTLTEQMWGFSQLNVTELSDGTHHHGVVTPEAGARLSVRVPPGIDANALRQAFEQRLREVAWPGTQITVDEVYAPVQPWAGDIEGRDPLTPLLGKALTMGYGQKTHVAGCGGTIGFFKPFGEAFPRAVMYGLGVEDPDTLAHAPNESLGPLNFFGAARGIAAYAYLVGTQG